MAYVVAILAITLSLSLYACAIPQQGLAKPFTSRHSILLFSDRHQQHSLNTASNSPHIQLSTRVSVNNPTHELLTVQHLHSARQLAWHFDSRNTISPADSRVRQSSFRLPLTVRPGLNEEACTSSAECESPRLCTEFTDGGDAMACVGGDCICLPADNSCTVTTDCDAGETCTELSSGSTVCVSNVVLTGDTLDFIACTSSAQCAPGRSCFGTSLTSGLLDCTASSCSCVNVTSNCDTFQDCLVDTACVRISPEIPASFCVANSLIIGSFPGGLTLSPCATDADCVGERSCLAVDDAGDVVPCAGASGCACAGGSNVGCESSRFCDFGETCSSAGTDAFCNAVADLA
eukprot:TRINITY_DN49188_c0_g1_i1.p1 TRINITY_DN49188_c0_g1~~TRINITY_DN49188_c0_g1_i1.p1  ORF type:complete len:379 (-),score=24.08 TRINITY_DN49188_c0_g1_i1:313-1353(-)